MMKRIKDLKILVDNLPNVAFYLIKPNGIYTFAGGEEMIKHGFNPYDVVGKHHSEILESLGVYEEFKPHIERAKNGEPNQFIHHFGPTAYLQSFIPLYKEDDTLERVLIVSQNLFKSKESESIIENMETMGVMGLYTMYVDDGIFRCSDALMKILGLEIKNITSEEYLKNVHPDDLPLTQEIIAKAVENKSTFAFDYRYKRPNNGKWVHITTTGYVTQESDGRLKFVGFKQDTSDYLNMQKLVDRMDDIISHGIKNRIANLKLLLDYSDVDISAIPDDNIKELLQMVKTTTKDLFEMVYDYRKIDNDGNLL